MNPRKRLARSMPCAFLRQYGKALTAAPGLVNRLVLAVETAILVIDGLFVLGPVPRMAKTQPTIKAGPPSQQHFRVVGTV